jgi:glycosyltransferase involved in cell wall biosynthesis
MPSRLAIIASHVIQYQDPFFRLLAAEPADDLTVIFCSSAGARSYHDREMGANVRWDLDLLQGYKHKFLRNFGYGTGYTRLINPGIVHEIVTGRYDAVVFMLGWGSISALMGIMACRGSDTPAFLFGDSSYPPKENNLRSRLRAAFLRIVFALVSGFMTSGVLNAEYYAHYGASRDKFFLLPWAVDNERFARAGEMSARENELLRNKYDIGQDKVVFLYSAKLLPRKDPLTLLRAYQQMAQRDRASLIFVGEGELRGELESYTRENKLEDGVRFAGFVNQADLPKLYAMADVFVLPSLYEPRGAVINEAMACGLPLIVTDRCGSIGDIVREGENTLIYPAGDAGVLSRHMDAMAEDTALRQRMAERSLEIIAGWDYGKGVEGILNMLSWMQKRGSQT